MKASRIVIAAITLIAACVGVGGTTAAYDSAPRNVVATASSTAAGTVDVDWDAPSAPSGLLGYTVVPRNASGTELTALSETVVGTGTGPIAVDGLTDGASYTFVVRARYDDGTSRASAASSAAVPFNTPLAPVISQTTAGDASVTLTWSAPDNRGSSITGYTITASPGGTTISADRSDTSKTFTGLVNGTEYTFTMVATNLRGDSDPSSATQPVTPFTTPSAPAAPTASAGDASVTVTWTLLDGDATPPEDGGADLTGYLVNAYAASDVVDGSLSDSATVVASTTAEPTANSAVVTSLTNGDGYVFTVIGQNEAGNGDESSPSSTATPIGTSAVAVTSVSPTVGSTDGGTSVTITGTGLTGVISVVFSSCGEAVESVSGNTDSSVTLTTPDSGCSAGASDVTVTASAGTAVSSSAFTFRNPPTITSLDVTSGTAAGGTTVIATGTGFVSGATSATLGEALGEAIRLTGLTVISPTSIRFTTPSILATQGGTLGAQDLVVTVAGLAPVTSTDAFTYTAATRAVTVASISDTQFGAEDVDVAISATGITGTITDPTTPAVVTFGTPINDGVCTPDASTLTVAIDGQGTCEFTVTVGASGLYAAGSSSVSFSVSRGTQTLSFVDPPSGEIPVTDASVTLTVATNGNGELAAVVDGASTSDCTVSTPTGLSFDVNFTTVGSCVIDVGLGQTDQFELAIDSITLTIAVVAPSAPTGLSVTAGDTDADVLWDDLEGSDDGGAAISGYVVEYRAGSSGDWTEFDDDASSPVTITGLTNGTSYQVRVAAVNSVGTGAFSDPVSVTPATVPGVASDVSVAAGDGLVVVSWEAPSVTGGSAITGYTVTASPGGRSCSTSGAVSCTVSGLTNGTSYTFTVVASNARGSGAASVGVSGRPLATPSAAVLEALPESLEVADSSPAPGSAVTIELDGFDPFEWVVLSVQSTPVVLGTAQADGDGRVSATVTIPTDLDEGVHTLSMLGTESGRGGRVEVLVTSDPDAVFDSEVFTAVTPARILDTRSGVGAAAGRVGALDGSGAAVTLQVTGRAGVPASASAVALNVTVVGGEANDFGGYVSVYPCGVVKPDVSNLNFVSGETVPNSVISPVSTDGTVCLYVYGTAHLLADVSGYFTSGFEPVTPTRLLDTRQSGTRVGTLDGTGSAVTLRIAGQGGVPATGATAVALNVTVVGGQANDFGGYVSVYPCDVAKPDVSNLNFVSGQTVPNSVVAPLLGSGDVCLYVYGTAHLLVDVSGYFTSGFSSVTPSRVLDTRSGIGAPAGRVGALDGSAAALEVQISGRADVPAGATAVALNVTVVGGESNDFGGYVTAYPCGVAKPDVSNLNFVSGQTVPNSVIAPLSDDGKVCLYVYGTANLLVDVSGHL